MQTEGSDVTVNSITLAGDDAANFYLEGDTDSGVLSAGDTRTLTVTFNPFTIGTKVASVVVDSSQGRYPVTLYGIGTNVTGCGNGIVDYPSETCDIGTLVGFAPQPGCSNCQVASGYVCTDAENVVSTCSALASETNGRRRGFVPAKQDRRAFVSSLVDADSTVASTGASQFRSQRLIRTGFPPAMVPGTMTYRRLTKTALSLPNTPNPASTLPVGQLFELTSTK